jgi:hypothetical protein
MIDPRMSVATDSKVSMNALGILALILKQDDLKGWCSREELIADGRLSIRPIKNALDELGALGVIETHLVGGAWIINPVHHLPPEVDSLSSGVNSLSSEDISLSDQDVEEESVDNSVDNSTGLSSEVNSLSPEDRPEGDRLTRRRTSRSFTNVKDNLCTTPPSPPSAPKLGGDEKDGVKNSERKFPDPIVLPFRQAPPEATRRSLQALGFRYDPDLRPCAWVASWTEEREAAAIFHEEQLLPVDQRPQFIQRTDPKPEPAPLLPPTDPDLQAVLDEVEQGMRPQTYRTWFTNTTLTANPAQDGTVTLWALSKRAAHHLSSRYMGVLREAFAAVGLPAPSDISVLPALTTSEGT